MTLRILLIILVFAAGFGLGTVCGDSMKRWLGRPGGKPKAPTPLPDPSAKVVEETPSHPVRARCGELQGEGERLPDPDKELLERATEYVNENLQRPELSVEELSGYLGMSRVHLYKKLRAVTGRTPIEFIRVMRLRHGVKLLEEGRHNVTEVAGRVGFNSPRIFSRYFKEEYGVLPSEYQTRQPGG